MSAQTLLEPVRINGHVFQPRDELHRRKLEALRVFVEHLLASPVRAQIAKIILFGSVARGEVSSESDIDVIVFGTRPLAQVEAQIVDAAWQTQLEMSESIEPLLYSVSAYDEPSSDFAYQVVHNGMEVYSMDPATLARQAAETFYALAVKYLAEARRKYELSDEASRRLAIDAAYNAAELCAKAMLRLNVNEMPKTHSGIHTLFSDKYVKTKKAPMNIGRDFILALKSRNLARYDGNAIISTEMVDQVFRFAEQMIALCEQTLAQSSSQSKQVTE